MNSVNVNVHHVTRVEGHGNIVVNVKDGVLEEAKFEIVESPRFFEAMLKGRRWDEAPYITSRICGICSVGHATASINALENALGVTPSEQTLQLRRLLMHGETMQSHWLHVYFLAAPDFFRAGSALALAGSHPDVVKMALRLKKLSNDLADMICGRKINPVAMKVNGFSHLPGAEQLKAIRARMVDARKDMETTVELLKNVEILDFTRDTEYLALSLPDRYAFIAGDIKSSEGGTYPLEKYLEVTNEHVVPHSTAKHARHLRDSYMVGALARFNINYDLLRPEAKGVAEALGLEPGCTNPYMNNVAQIVETVHCLEDGIEIIDDLLSKGLKKEPREVKVRAGRGIGAAEVPRGTLYHDYTIDDKGYITGANCIIPTAQNLANIEQDMGSLVPQILDRSKDDITLALEMLVRAYDPCISCSTHFVEVTFTK